MSRYLQTSTGNPYGHRPWATRLYTEFENYGFLKQPQNSIIREDVNMRPRIYRPPEMKADTGLGSVTIVGGSGRILARRRRGMLGAVMIGNGGGIARSNLMLYRPPVPGPMPYPISRPICSPAPPPAGCTYVGNPCAAASLQCAPPFQILPPPMVPPPPQPIASGPGGIVYALPGDATTPGSPFAPAGPQLPLAPGAVPAPSAAAAAASAAATPPVSAAALSDWFNAQTWIAGVPNGYVALGGAFAIYLFAKKKR